MQLLYFCILHHPALHLTLHSSFFVFHVFMSHKTSFCLLFLTSHLSPLLDEGLGSRLLHFHPLWKSFNKYKNI